MLSNNGGLGGLDVGRKDYNDHSECPIPRKSGILLKSYYGPKYNLGYIP